MGVPRLACLRPVAWLRWGLAWPIFISPSPRPSRGAKPRGADDRKLPQERPQQAGSRGGGEINARVPCEDPMMQAMTIKARRAPGGRQAGVGMRKVLVSPLVQRGQAQAKVSGKGYHSGATRPRLVGRPDGGHRGAQDGVITSAFGSRRPPLVRITCTRCSPSKWPIVGALPAQLFEERPRASINRASHHRVERGEKT